MLQRICRLVIVLSLAWPVGGWAAWTDTTRHSADGTANTTSFNFNHTGAVSGTFLVCGASVWNTTAAPTTVTISDATNGSYTQAAYVTNGVQGAGLWYKANTVTGTITVVIATGGTTSDVWVACREFDGEDASPADGAASTNTGSSGTSSTGTVTPGYQDSLLVAITGVDSASAITENAGSQGFTLSDEYSSVGQPGSLVFKIISGNPGSPSHSWTNGNAAWASAIQAFRASGAAAVGGGATLHILPLMGVGQ